jgi:hypothetical protein
LKLHEIAPAQLVTKVVPQSQQFAYDADTARSQITKRSLRAKSPFAVHGVGIAGTAFSKERLPQEVRKVGSGWGDPEKHGYLLFVQLSLQMQHNPHFPRIYKAKAHKYKQSSLGFVVDMEPLTHGREVPEGLMKAALKRYLGFTDKDIAEGQGSPYYQFAEQLDRMLQYPESYQEFMQKSHDELFKEAVTALRKIKIDKSLMIDMHTGNVMYRVARHGAIPVIIDPFA